jgi:hypothetical protein
MNTEALFLFLILLLGLVLCSFLGGNCEKEGMTVKNDVTDNSNINSGASSGSRTQYDNYNHYTGSSTQLLSGSTFYGQNGTNAIVVANSDGTQSLQIILPGSSIPVIFSTSLDDSSSSVNYESATTYYGPNGATAIVVNTDNGQQAIMVKTSSGTYYYNISGSNTSGSNTSTQYYGSTGTHIQPTSSLAYQIDVTEPDYSSTLPPGIPKSQIPSGQENLYILKSQIVPPVCPACPSSSVYPRQEPCPACPPCGRCPEPAFECKKVPNYNAINNDYLPAPVLNNFSTFGM